MTDQTDDPGRPVPPHGSGGGGDNLNLDWTDPDWTDPALLAPEAQRLVALALRLDRYRDALELIAGLEDVSADDLQDVAGWATLTGPAKGRVAELFRVRDAAIAAEEAGE